MRSSFFSSRYYYYSLLFIALPALTRVIDLLNLDISRTLDLFRPFVVACNLLKFYAHDLSELTRFLIA